MSKIVEWRNAQRVHAELVDKSRQLCELPQGFVDVPCRFGVDVAMLGREWRDARIDELYADLLEFSRQKVLRLAREALAEVETVKANALRDIESIEEQKQC